MLVVQVSYKFCKYQTVYENEIHLDSALSYKMTLFQNRSVLKMRFLCKAESPDGKPGKCRNYELLINLRLISSRRKNQLKINFLFVTEFSNLIQIY